MVLMGDEMAPVGNLAVADLLEGGLALPQTAWRSAAQFSTPLTLSRCSIRHARRDLGPESAIPLADMATPGGRGFPGDAEFRIDRLPKVAINGGCILDKHCDAVPLFTATTYTC